VGLDAFQNVPEPDWGNYPRGEEPVNLRDMDFSLVDGSKAIDAGEVIPGITHDDYAGDAPDLGAIEHGMAKPHYGPRTQSIER
jgi:hypothetical protein